MIKVSRDTIYKMRLKDGYYVQGEIKKNDWGQTLEFWLCRHDYGQKEYLFGVKCESRNDVPALFETFSHTFKDEEYMSDFLERFF